MTIFVFWSVVFALWGQFFFSFLPSLFLTSFFLTCRFFRRTGNWNYLTLICDCIIKSIHYIVLVKFSLSLCSSVHKTIYRTRFLIKVIDKKPYLSLQLKCFCNILQKQCSRSLSMNKGCWRCVLLGRIVRLSWKASYFWLGHKFYCLWFLEQLDSKNAVWIRNYVFFFRVLVSRAMFFRVLTKWHSFSAVSRLKKNKVLAFLSCQGFNKVR